MVDAAGSTLSRRSKLSACSSVPEGRSDIGLVHIDVQPDIEPLKLVRADLRIPDGQRICSNPNCLDDQGEPTKLKLDKGFCPKCRTKYSFLQIDPGTIVGTDEVKGPIAIGGCGFVYLGWDLNVERFVVIKGLINSMTPWRPPMRLKRSGFCYGNSALCELAHRICSAKRVVPGR